MCLDWETANEKNVSHFEIQRSTDGTTFTAIDKVNAKNQSANNYNYTDDLTNLSDYSQFYFRIKQIDTDEKNTLSIFQMVLVNNFKTPAIYPNPVEIELHVSNISSIMKIQVVDMRGRNIKSWNSNFSNLPVNDLASGIYIVKIILKNGEVMQQKIVKQ